MFKPSSLHNTGKNDSDKFMLDIYLFKGNLQVFMDFSKRFIDEIKNNCEHQGPFFCEVEGKKNSKDKSSPFTRITTDT
jgi:hypothetical protein